MHGAGERESGVTPRGWSARDVGFRLFAIVFGVALCAVPYAVLEIVCGFLLHRYGHQVVMERQNAPLALGKTNQEILGAAATAHGLFPPPPPVVQTAPASLAWTDDIDRVYEPETDVLGYIGNLPFRVLVESVRETARIGQQTIFSAFYTIDRFARRVVPGEAGKDGCARFLLLVGCSFTFGQGLQDDETLAARISQRAPNTRVYNYGMFGAGVGEVLLRLMTISKGEEIPEERGTVLFLFIDHNAARTLGRASVIGSWGADRLRIVLDEAGYPSSDGTFREMWPVRTYLFSKLMKTNWVRYFGIDIPWGYSDGELESITEMLRLMRDASTARLGADFYVVFFPGTQMTTRLIPLLERRGISYIDYSHWNMPKLIHGPGALPDGHPSAETNQLLGESLSRVLGVN